ncbi:MAG: flagellar motor protein MotD [Zoogloeaceae bacterium]|jgi:chemotaxis protein MotB|nr:flagellar motor protein MotD [Zoogloeaceae bacterium]
MSRRKSRHSHEEEHENLERWLVSYADFITLLFAFFVVMYALSTINESKYRMLAESINTAFRNLPDQKAVVSGGVLVAPPVVVPAAPTPASAMAKEVDDEAKKQRRTKMRNMAREIMEALAPLVREGKVRVLETSRGVTVEISDSVLFAPGQARLESASVSALEAVAEVLVGGNYPITIEGHTDNVPIQTPQFPSNWELSAVRATTVLRLFSDVGVDPANLTAIGYGEQRPVSGNDTVEGRAHNRRVSILIDSTAQQAPSEVLEELSAGQAP